MISYGDGMHEDTWEGFIKEIIFDLYEKSVEYFIQARSWLTTNKAREQKSTAPTFGQQNLSTPTFSSFSTTLSKKHPPRMLFNEEIIQQSLDTSKTSENYEQQQTACLMITDLLSRSLIPFHSIFEFQTDEDEKLFIS